MAACIPVRVSGVLYMNAVEEGAQRTTTKHCKDLIIKDNSHTKHNNATQY